MSESSPEGLVLKGVAPPKVFDLLADERKGGSILGRFEGAWWRLLPDGRLFFEPSRLNDPLSNGYVLQGSYAEAGGSLAFVAESFRGPGRQLALDGFIRSEGGRYALDCLFVDEGSGVAVLHVTQQLAAWDGRETSGSEQTIKGLPVPALYDLRLTGATTSGEFGGVAACLYTTYSFSTLGATEPDDVHFNIGCGSALEPSEDRNGACTLIPPLDTFLSSAAGALPSEPGFTLATEGGRIRLEAEGGSGAASVFSWREVEESPEAGDGTPRTRPVFCEARSLRFDCAVTGESVTGEIRASGFTTEGGAARYEATFAGRRAADAPQPFECLERKVRLNAAERGWRDEGIFEGEWQSHRFGSVRLRRHGGQVAATFAGEPGASFEGAAAEHRLTVEGFAAGTRPAVLRAVRGGQFLAMLFPPRGAGAPEAELLYSAGPTSKLVEGLLRDTSDPPAWGRMADVLKSLDRHDEALTLYEKLYEAAGENRRRARHYSEEWTWFFGHEWGALLNVMNCFQMRQLLLSGVHPRFRPEEGDGDAAFEYLLNALEHAVTLQEELQELARRAAAEGGVEFPDFGARLAQQVESWRRLLDSEAGRLRALELGQRPLARLLKVLAAGGSQEQALVAAESARARVFSDLMQTRIQRERAQESFAALPPEEVEKMLAGRMAATAPVEPEALKRTARELRCTFVEYYLGDEELFIWVLRPDGEVHSHRHRRPGLKQALTDLVEQTRARLGVQTREAAMKSTGRAPREYLPPLAELHRALVAPIARWLPDAEQDEVVFVPHDVLYLVPFPALFDGRYLIERHTVSVAPSIRFVETAHRLSASRVSRPPGVLVAGDPLMPFWPRGDAAAHRLPPLEFARREAAQVAQRLRTVAGTQTVALLGEDARRASVVEALPEQGLVHLATHALIEDAGAGGEVPGAIALGPSGEDDGYLTASQIAALHLRARLVVMSACNTGRGRLSADGVVGLVRAFLTAGAECVVASLWSVGDQSTQELMVRFYDGLLRGRPAAHALRGAMLDLKAGPPYDNPLHWAAFTVTGQCREPLFGAGGG
jgi:CHAT domain-containing protein